MSIFTRKLLNEPATIAFGKELSLFCRKGLVICLYGDLGAGKTTLARALIQAMCLHSKDLDVPSPTFSLLQPYDELRIPVHHYDLYRIDQIDEAYELGLFDDQHDRLTIIEWPERLGDEVLENRLDIRLEIENDYRMAKVTGTGFARAVAERVKVVRDFLATGPWRAAERDFLQGDASARRYERLDRGENDKAILMDMPESPDGPIIKNGKTYSAIAHIAEGIRPVAAINSKLHELGFSAPLSLQQDLANGLMVIEDFGDKVFGNIIERQQDIFEPLKTATELLAVMAAKDWPDILPDHQIPAFDLPAFQIETDLLLEWFWPMQMSDTPDKSVADAFSEIWKQLFKLVDTGQKVWVLRDFHSPNLIWMPDRQGIKRVGLIDTQDCLLGHPAYDLVSMLQDARVDLPDGFEAKLFKHYCRQRTEHSPDFDIDDFETAYAVLGAQRATKILGIFARLYKRDGKPGYLKHIPRVSAALEKNLEHPVLGDLADWYHKNLPETARHTKEEL